MKFIREKDEDLNDMQRRINQLIEVQQMRENVYHKSRFFSGKNEKGLR